MRKVFKIAGNELRALFYSPIAWFVLIVFIFQTNVSFADSYMSSVKYQFLYGDTEYGLTASIFSSIFGLFPMLQNNLYLYIPLLTMGLMSRELSSGSVKLLYSSPVRASQIVAGKFLSVMVYGAVLMGVICIPILVCCATIPHADLGLMLSGLLGIYLLLCAYAAIGLYMSCLTSYQVVAALGALAVLIVFNYIGQVGQGVEFIRDITYWLSIKGRVSPFINGLICSEHVLYFVIVILFFLTLAVMRIESRRAKRSRLMTVGRYLGVGVVTVLLGYLTSRPVFLLYKDMTAGQTQTLSPKTQEILKRVDGKLTVTTYVNLLGLNYSYGLPKSLNADLERFKPYLRFKPDIELRYEYYYKDARSADADNPFRRKDERSEEEKAKASADFHGLDMDMFMTPEEIDKKIDLSEEGYRFVRRLSLENGKSTFLRLFEDMLVFSTEQEMAAALERLLAPVPVVAFLSGHGERAIDNIGDEGYYCFTNNHWFRYALINQGFDVMDFQIRAGQDIPENVKILVIADVKKALTPDELEVLKRYVERGDNLLIAGEPGREEAIKPLLDLLGMELKPGILVQQTKDFSPDLIQATFSQYAVKSSEEYARLQKKKLCIVMPGASSLEVTKNVGFRVDTLLKTQKENCWNELETKDFTSQAVVLNTQAGEVEKEYPLAYALSRQRNGVEQRIIVLGDADCISNAELQTNRDGIDASNYSLITESFHWLSNGRFPVKIIYPDPRDVSVVVGITGGKVVKYALLLVLPLLVIAVGIWINYRRRRK